MTKFTRTKLALALLVLIPLTIPRAEASTRMVTAPNCEEPVPMRTYDDKSMTYGISIDLRGCSWWNGSPIQLTASLTRLDGTWGLGEEGTTTGTVCGGWPETTTKDDKDGRGKDDADDGDRDEPGDVDPVDDSDEGDDEDASDKREGAQPEDDEPEGRSRPASVSADRFTCQVSTTLEHPSAEVALYQGEISYPWKDGEKTVGFSAWCASPGSVCREVSDPD